MEDIKTVCLENEKSNTSAPLEGELLSILPSPLADVKWSSFPNASGLTGSEFFTGLQSGINVLFPLSSNVLPYFNSHIQISESQVTNLVSDLASKLNLSGGTMTGFLTLNSDPTTALQAATKQYVDNSILSAPYVLKAGDTMTGNLIINADLSIGTSSTFAPITIAGSGGTTYSSALLAYFGSVSTAPDTNLFQIVIDKSSSEALLIGINGIPALSGCTLPDDYSYLSTYTSTGGFGICTGNTTVAGTPGTANFVINGTGQVNIPNSLTIGSFSISSNALLALNSSTQGMKPVTMKTADMNNIPVTADDAGLTVYVTDMVNGYYYFDGANWVYVSNSGSSGNTLQAAYDNGNTISLSSGFPFYVSNQSGLTNFVWMYSPGAPSPYNYSSLEGVRFTPTVNVSVTALQYVNQYFPSGSRQVAIFRTSDQSLIVSDLVYKTDPLDGTGNYRTHEINPVTLYAGTSYIVVCIIPANENWPFYSLSSPADFNYTGITFGQAASTIVYPTTIAGSANSIYGNQNFQYSKVSSSVSVNDGAQHSLLNIYSTTQGLQTASWSSSQETTNLIPLTLSDAGLSWFNSTTSTQNYWTGTDLNQILTVQNLKAGTNITLDKSVPGQVIINSSGGGSGNPGQYSSFSVNANSVATVITTINTFYPVYLGSSFSSNDSLDFTNQFLSITGMSTPVMTSNSATTQFYNVNVNFSCRGANPSQSNYVISLYIRQANGTIVPTNYSSSVTLSDLIVNMDISVTGNVQLAQGDSVYVAVQNTSSTNNIYFIYATYSITSIAGSIPNTDGLAQGTNNQWLSQNGGTTYEYLSGTATVGNLAEFNSAGGQLIDSGVPAASVMQYVLVPGLTQQMAMNKSYIITSTSPTPVTFTLPPTSAGIGKIEVSGYGSANWIVQTNAGQTIIDNGLSSTVSATSSTPYDNATFIYAGNGSGIFQVTYQNGMQINLT